MFTKTGARISVILKIPLHQISHQYRLLSHANTVVLDTATAQRVSEWQQTLQGYKLDMKCDTNLVFLPVTYFEGYFKEISVAKTKATACWKYALTKETSLPKVIWEQGRVAAAVPGAGWHKGLRIRNVCIVFVKDTCVRKRAVF